MRSRRIWMPQLSTHQTSTFDLHFLSPSSPLPLISNMDRFNNLTFSRPQMPQMPQMPQTSAMTSYLSNILTTATSKANNLRRALISSEADGDTEDDSHIARVLRAYYNEKGRSRPEWLPPDPKAPTPAPAQMVSSSGAQQSPYGQVPWAASRWGRGGGLSDLWDNGSKPQQQEDPSSLRARPGLARANVSSASDPRAGSRFGDSLEEPAPARPLPSQRAGSYQTQFSQSATTLRPIASDTSPPTSAGSGSTAQERLKQRLWGARSNSPTPSSSNVPSQPLNSSPAAGRNPYAESEGKYSSSSRTSDDRSYSSSGGAAAGRYGGGSGSSNRPYVSANSPWSGNDDPYAPSGAGYGGGGYGGGPYASSGGGLPSGPRGPRQGGVGLPSGPRPQR